jgi:hypothetical protein
MNPDARRLDDLLDSIDSQRKKLRSDPGTARTGSGAAYCESSGSIGTAPAATYTWSKHFDHATQKFYYYNLKTHVSTWEKPLLFDEERNDYEASSLVKASFSARDATFASSGAETYFEKVGRPNDREGLVRMFVYCLYQVQVYDRRPNVQVVSCRHFLI